MASNSKTILYMTIATLALFFSKILVFITPLPFIFYFLKNDKKEALNATLPSLVFVVLFYFGATGYLFSFCQSHPTLVWMVPVPAIELFEHFSVGTIQAIGIAYFLILLSISYFIPLAFRSQKRLFRVLFWGVIGIFIVFGLSASAYVLPQGGSLYAEYQSYMNEGIQRFIEVQRQSGASIEAINEFKAQIGDFVQYSFYMLPFVFLLTLSFLVVVNLVIARRFFASRYPFLNKIKLTAFEVPFQFVWIVIGLLAAFLLNKLVLHNDGLGYVLLNFMFGLGIVYFLQGLAVVVFFLNRRNIRGFARLLVYFGMLLFAQTTAFALASLGFFEYWMNVRKPDDKDSQKPKDSSEEPKKHPFFAAQDEERYQVPDNDEDREKE